MFSASQHIASSQHDPCVSVFVVNMHRLRHIAQYHREEQKTSSYIAEAIDCEINTECQALAQDSVGCLGGGRCQCLCSYRLSVLWPCNKWRIIRSFGFFLWNYLNDATSLLCNHSDEIATKAIASHCYVRNVRSISMLFCFGLLLDCSSTHQQKQQQQRRMYTFHPWISTTALLYLHFLFRRVVVHGTLTLGNLPSSPKDECSESCRTEIENFRFCSAANPRSIFASFYFH